MKEYATKDIANIVGIATPTVRKYSQALEKAGYGFTKNDRGFRIFTENDISIFKEIITKSNDTGMNVEQIALMLVKQGKNDSNEPIQTISDVAIPVEIEHGIEDSIYIVSEFRSLKETVNQQNLLIQKLVEKMDQQQKYIDEKLEQRDRTLLESIRQSQEEKQALLQIAAAAQEEQKKGFIARLFGR